MRLANGLISFEQLGGPLPPTELVRLPLGEVVVGDGEITGTIDILDIRFGSLWTNIPADSFRALGVLPFAVSIK